MNNAAILFAPDGYDTTGDRLMGRHAAGESFLRGFLRHADVDAFHFFNVSPFATPELENLVTRIEPPTKPLNWIDRRARPQLSAVGCLYHPTPGIAQEAWLRRPFGSRTYSICGITHTTATHRIMDAVADLLTAPVEPWDALICTSTAVRDSIGTLLDAVGADLRERTGATRLAKPQLATIPLGVNADDFTAKASARQAWRDKLDIPSDAIVALYVGRFSAGSKMNPALMAMTLEAAAQATGRDIYWIVSGWSGTLEGTEIHHARTREFCPSIHYRGVDGRDAATRFSIWSAADLFISFSENIQETFGLTPIEAMAAGLPCVVSDWDGYRDTVRDGIDGFRIKTIAPRPGLGRDLAYGYANDWVTYDQYISAAAAMTAIDLTAATDAVIALIEQPDLRHRMGQAAALQAQQVFDWSVIIPQYQALWAELAQRRAAAQLGPQSVADNPRRPDPFSLFAGYPTATLTPQTLVRIAPGMTWEIARTRLNRPFGTIGQWAMPFPAERQAMYAYFETHGPATVADMLTQASTRRQPFLERGVLWLVKFGILQVL